MNESNSNSNVWKIVLAVVALAAVLVVFVAVPYLNGTPDPGPDVQTPSMKNVPPSGALTLEVDRNLAPSDAKDQPEGE